MLNKKKLKGFGAPLAKQERCIDNGKSCKTKKMLQKGTGLHLPYIGAPIAKQERQISGQNKGKLLNQESAICYGARYSTTPKKSRIIEVGY